MEIKDLLEAKWDMEREIRDAATLSIAKFREKTGFSPRYIGADMVDVSTLGEIHQRYVIARVRTDVHIADGVKLDD